MNQRVAVITGAGRGIGAAVARQLNAAGMQVVGFDRTPGSDPAVRYLKCDITDPDAIDAAYLEVEAEIGIPTVIVANAGITKDALAMRMSQDDWDRVIDINLTGTYRVIQRGLRGMMKERWGRIVVLSSVVAFSGSAGQVNYAASKAGLIGMARSLAREVGGRGITCNAVTPGFIETDMTAVLSEEIRTKYLQSVPASRLGTVDDVAAAVRFLVSEEASYITGAVVPVDGGMGMGH